MVLAAGIQTSLAFILGSLRPSPGSSPLSLAHRTLTVSIVYKSHEQDVKMFFSMIVFYLGANGPVGE